MKENGNFAVQSVQEAVLNLLDLVDQAGRGEGEDVAVISEEAQKVVLMLIAAIVLSDEKYSENEAAFMRVLVDCQENPGGHEAFVNEYAEEWKRQCTVIPHFYQVAVRHDSFRGTDLGRSMLREIQLIGNNTSVSDGAFEPQEHRIVREYLLLLENFAQEWQSRTDRAPRETVNGWESI